VIKTDSLYKYQRPDCAVIAASRYMARWPLRHARLSNDT